MTHPDTGQRRRTRPSTFLGITMLCGALTVAGGLGGFLIQQRHDNNLFRHEIQQQERSDLCDLIIAVAPRTPDEVQVGPYGARIQSGVHASGLKIGCALPPRPTPTASPSRAGG